MLSNSVSFVNKKLCRAEVFSGILTNLPKEPGHNQIKQLKRKLVTRKGCFRSKTKKNQFHHRLLPPIRITLDTKFNFHIIETILRPNLLQKDVLSLKKRK